MSVLNGGLELSLFPIIYAYTLNKTYFSKIQKDLKVLAFVYSVVIISRVKKPKYQCLNFHISCDIITLNSSKMLNDFMIYIVFI